MVRGLYETNSREVCQLKSSRSRPVQASFHTCLWKYDDLIATGRYLHLRSRPYCWRRGYLSVGGGARRCLACLRGREWAASLLVCALRVQGLVWLLSLIVTVDAVFVNSSKMQYYAAHPNVPQGRHPEYTGYPAGPVATSPRMNWSPTMHPGAWPPYDFSAAYPAAYPSTSADSQRSPPYNMTSPSDHTGTPHNIRDILGGQQSGTLLSEVAKTPSSYQKSPTSTAVTGAMTFAEHHVRSPTTPTAPPPVVYSSGELPSSFYIPRPLPGTQPGSVYDSTSFFPPCCLII